MNATIQKVSGPVHYTGIEEGELQNLQFMAAVGYFALALAPVVFAFAMAGLAKR